MLTRSYPSADDLYQYPFVHRRVLAYRALGHDVAVFRHAEQVGTHVFEGIACHSGPLASFAAAIGEFSPDVLAVHGLSEEMWPALVQTSGLPVCAWLHGSEIPEFFRTKARAQDDPQARANDLAAADRRAGFWRDVLGQQRSRLRIAFPSRNAVQLMERDCAPMLHDHVIAVLHNPIDTDLFAYHPKIPAAALRVLSIRPYTSATYANDLAVGAVLALESHPRFAEMRFTFVGDGPLFETTLAPLRNLANVVIERGFLTQPEIARRHADHGIFLVPTRLDTQGVSRDEAMASGLVPVTNAVFAVPEFVDTGCAGVAPAEDAAELARAIAAMVDDPALFLARSRAAAARVRAQSAHGLVISAELAWMAQAVLRESPADVSE